MRGTIEYETDEFIGQFNGGVTENLSVAGVAAAEDTDPLELASGEALLHSKNRCFSFFLWFMISFKLKIQTIATTTRHYI